MHAQGRRTVVGLLAAAATSLGGPSGPVASRATVVRSVTLLPLPNAAQKLSAYGGYVIFSQANGSGNWHLVLWHAGSTTTLPVGEQPQPFDAELGPSADGRPALVYSECKEDPAFSEFPELAARCRIYQLGLPRGRPRLLKTIYSPGASDSTPAIWNGDIAFARHRAGATTVSIYLWHHDDRHLVRLGGGPASCPANSDIPGIPLCEKPVSGLASWVDGMSLGPAGLAYEWTLRIPNVTFGASAEPEIRLDRLRAGRQWGPGKLIATRFTPGTCGGSEGVSPRVVGQNVLYALTFGECPGPEVLFSRFALYSTPESRPRRRAAPLERGLVVALAPDGGTTYWIRDVLLESSITGRCPTGNSACGGSVFSQHADCSPTNGTCTLMRTDGLRSALGWR